MTPRDAVADAARTAHWNRLKELFSSALELPPTERDAFVAGACSDDAELRHELRELIRSAEVDDGFIEQPAADTLGWSGEIAERDHVGPRIGPYRILGLAGRGGLSRVYRAVREGTGYEQQVAVKLLRPGFGDETLLRRFRAERRMLAALAHPHIAHFLDGGAADDGTPYLVMEFVEGLPLDEYCDVNALALEARIDLFRVLCGAVHYVHQHLMVHGDLKGSNVLVKSDGVLKLLDFGIAKLLTPDAATGDPTRPATLMLLTPDYASPEQLRGEPITTASDVYSLGTLLYRLLTGTTPYDTAHAAPAVILERMAAGGPMPPDAAAERTGGTYSAFARALRGDLGTILLRVIKKEPGERYSSAQQLADDLHRWLRGFPVEARPDSMGYRLRKWTQRHRTAAILSSLAVTALIGGIAASSWQAHLAGLERERAERNFTAVRELSSVFLADVYQAIAKIPGTTEARKLLVDNTLKYLQALERDSRDSPELLRDLATAYERLADVQGAYIDPSLGDRASALANYRRALGIRQQLSQDIPSLAHRADLLQAEAVLVEALLGAGDLASAQQLGTDMVRVADQIDADPAAGRKELRTVGAAFMTQGWMEWSGGRVESGLASLIRAREVYRRIADEHPDDRLARRDIALVTGRLGEAHADGTGDLEKAIRYYRETLAALEPLVRDDPDDGELARMKIYTGATIGRLYNLLGRPSEGLRELEAVLPEFRRMREADPADQTAPFALAAALNISGESRLQRREFELARGTFEEAVALVDSRLAASVPDLQLVEGVARAGLAQALGGISSMAPSGAARAAARQRAERDGHRALELLEPLTAVPQTAKDAKRQIESLRVALGWIG
jgi:eukaryotic-like serine/threonine-protein kinase